jgi:hypothetical protein
MQISGSSTNDREGVLAMPELPLSAEAALDADVAGAVVGQPSAGARTSPWQSGDPSTRADYPVGGGGEHEGQERCRGRPDYPRLRDDEEQKVRLHTRIRGLPPLSRGRARRT